MAAVSNAGYESVGMADSIQLNGAELVLPSFEARTEEALTKILTDNRLDALVNVANPFDVTPMAGDTAFTDMIVEVLGDRGVDVAVVGIVPLTPAMQTLAPGEGHHESINDPSSIAKRLPAAVTASDKPVVAVIDSGVLFDPLVEALRAGGLPVFRSADRAVRALCKWVDVKRRNASS